MSKNRVNLKKVGYVCISVLTLLSSDVQAINRSRDDWESNREERSSSHRRHTSNRKNEGRHFPKQDRQQEDEDQAGAQQHRRGLWDSLRQFFGKGRGTTINNREKRSTVEQEDETDNHQGVASELRRHFRDLYQERQRGYIRRFAGWVVEITQDATHPLLRVINRLANRVYQSR